MSSLLTNFLNNRVEPVERGGVVSAVFDYSSDEDNSEPDCDDTDPQSDTEQKKYVEEEIRSYFKEPEEIGGFNDIDDGNEESMIGSEICGLIGVPRVFGAYRFDTYYKKELPIDSYREQILALINTNSVVVISGKTGCGKTTQVPQYILDQCKATNAPCNIVVTQPRRIAAINISQRVCEERGWALGTVVGYQVGLDKQVSEDVVLTYMTTEVLLQKLIVQKNLSKYTHVIIDEVHERSKHLDLLLLIVRKYLFTNSLHVKIVLMSATMTEKDFAYYFRSTPRNEFNNPLMAPVLRVGKASEFTVSYYYIDNLKNITQGVISFDIDEPTISEAQYELAAKLVGFFSNTDEVDPLDGTPVIGSVLIFLPGFHEIEEMAKYLGEKKFTPEHLEWEIIPLHSSLTTETMTKAFHKPKPGVRKIILSTNIAESSLTVPDVNYVIDFCLTKVMVVNPITKFSSLSLQWASHVNCKQRAGRVGRVANGRVYRLVPEKFYKDQMSTFTVPEIQRAPLENIILYLKLLGLTDAPKNVLALALSPPNLKDVETCIWHLKEVGALLPTCRGKTIANDGDLTFLGRIMGSLPLDIHLSKLIVLGHLFSCLEEAVIMAAGSTTRNLFVNTFHERLTCFRKKLIWSDGSRSDFITLLNLYNVWLSSKRDNSFRTPHEELMWCRKNFINMKGLREWEILIKEINSRLKKFNIERPVGPERYRVPAQMKPLIIKVMICGAFYPNYFLRSSDYGQIDAQEAVKLLNGRDPFNTVYFTNMKLNQPGHIYVRKIKELLKTDSNVQIGFDGQSSKIFVEFRNIQQPEPVMVDGAQMLAQNLSKISMDVFVAIRRRQLRIPHRLKVLPDHLAWEFATSAEEKLKKDQVDQEVNCFTYVKYNPVPSLDIEYMNVRVSHIIDAGHFYCQHVDEETFKLINVVYGALNGPGVLLDIAEKVVIEDKLYAAMFEQDGKFYRCKVKSILPDTSARKGAALVMFIDYGNTQIVLMNRIYELPEVEECYAPPIAICCMLSEVQPACNRYPNGLWGEDANTFVERKTHAIELHAKVYSVVDNVVHVQLYSSSRSNNQSLNELLIAQGFAEKSEESYLSKEDHSIRLAVLQSDNPTTEASQYLNATKLTRYQDFEQPKFKSDYEMVELKGPFNPLEMKVCGIVQASTGVTVHIEDDSVNTVLLDDNPTDPHARLIVAGSVIQSNSGQALKLGQTTVMPNIRGFPMYMILTYCPIMDPKLTADGKRIASILCGLGFKGPADNRSNFPNHDISYVLDTELDEQTIFKVNMLRYTMNQGIKTMCNIASEDAYATEFYAIQKNMIDHLDNLLKREPPNSVDRVVVSHAYTWNKYSCSDNTDLPILKMKHEDDEEDIWRMLWFVKLNNDKKSALSLEKNLSELLEIAKLLIPPKDITCQLCNSQVLRTVADVRIHLFRNEHKQKYAEFKSEIDN